MPDRIKSLTLKGFRSIRALEDFALRPMNVLIGANGAGKSSANGMTRRPEVNRDVGKSCPAAPTEGTRHRRGKGAGRSTGRTVGSVSCRRPPAKERLVEAIGVWPGRTKVKRRKASVTGWGGSQHRSPISVGVTGVLATERPQSLLFLPREICWAPRER